MTTVNDDIASLFQRPIAAPVYGEIHWRIENMSYEELCSLYAELSELEKWLGFDEERTYDRGAIRRICTRIKELKVVHEGGNKAISELIQEFEEKESEEVAGQLYDRFLHQSLKDQKRIFNVLLKSEYIGYAYSLIENNMLGKLFIEELQADWLQNGSYRAERLVIKYASEEFLLKHITKLTEQDQHNYHLLCIRLGNNPHFVIDKTLFDNRWDYYSVLCVLEQGVSREEILHELFGAIKEVVLNKDEVFSELRHVAHLTGEDKQRIPIDYLHDICMALGAMRDAGLNEELQFFYDWNNDIHDELKDAISESFENRGVQASLYDMWMLYCKLVEEKFPILSTATTKHRDMILDKLQPMLEEFDLETANSTFDNFPPHIIKIPFEKEKRPWLDLSIY